MTATGPDERPQFEISVEDGRGLLLLKPRTFFDWLLVPQLDLAIPNVTFPLDITGGLASFRKQRLTLLRAGFIVDEVQAQKLVDSRAAALRNAGFEEVRIRVLPGMAELTGRARVGGQEADFVARATVEVGDVDLRLAIREAHVLGYLRRPAHLVVHDLLCVTLKAAAAVAPATAGDPASGPTAEGLGVVSLRPLELFFHRVLQPAGWRLPDTSRMRVMVAELAQGRAEIRYAQGTLLAEHLNSRSSATPGADAADELLLKNDLAGAAAAYKAELKRHSPDAEALIDRLLSVLCARDKTLGEAEKLAHEAFRRWPHFLPAQRTLVAAAMARGKLAEAAEHLEKMVELAEAGGDAELAARCALAAARVIATTDGAKAAALYRRVAAYHPGDDEAIHALAELHAASGAWSELVALWRSVVEAAKTPERRIEAHLHIGEVLLTRLHDPRGAVVELEAVVGADPASIRGWDLLARAREEAGLLLPAVEALDRLSTLLTRREDTVLRERTHLRIAGLREAAGELEGARAIYRKVLETQPGDPDALERLAAIAARAGELDEAIAGYRKLVETCPPGNQRRLRAERELLRLYVKVGDVASANGCLVAGAAPPDPEALVGLAVLERGLQHNERARELLDAALPAIPPASPLYFRAAGELWALARVAGDLALESVWLDLLIGPEAPRGADRHTLLTRRVQLHVDAGEADAARALMESLLSELDEPPAPALRVLYARILGAVGDKIGCASELELAAEDSPDPAGQVSLLSQATHARLAAGDVDGAFVSIKRAEAIDPKSAEVRSGLADVAWHTQDWEGVAALYASLIEEVAGPEGHGGRVETARRLGRALEQLGRPREALVIYRAGIDEPEAAGEPLAASWARAGELHEHLGDYRQAADAFVAAALDARTAEAPAARAASYRRAAELMHRRLGDQAGAVDAFEQALRLVPADLEALDGLESIWSELGEEGRIAEVQARRTALQTPEERAAAAPPPKKPPVNAPALLRALAPSDQLDASPLTSTLESLKSQLAALPPEKVEMRRATRLQLGEVYRQIGDLDQAYEALRSVLNEQPASVPALNGLSEICAARGAWAEAAGCLEKLARLQQAPLHRAEVLFRLGELYREALGDEKTASDAYLRAIDLDPRHVPTLRRLADWFAREGDFTSVLEMGMTLEEEGALWVDDTALETRARVALSAALMGDAQRALAGARGIGEAGAAALVAAVAEAAAHETAPKNLPEAVRAVARAPGPALAEVKRKLAELGRASPRISALAARL